MTSKYFIDTNILVYAYDISEPVKRAKALRILDRVIVSGTGTLSTQVLAEFFVGVTRKIRLPLSKAEATGRVKELAEIFPMIEMTTQTVIDACQATLDYPLSYYDAQIWASAQRNGVGVVLSEDLTDHGEYGEVRIINPILPEFNVESLNA